MPTRDNATNTKEVVALAPATITTTTTGLTVDTRNYDRVSFRVKAGPSGDTLSGTVKLEFDLQESTDGQTGWAFCGDYDLVIPTPQSANHEGIGVANGATNSGAFFLATSNTPLALVAGAQPIFTCGYIGTKRFLRLNVQVTGTQTNGTPISADAILSGIVQSPTYGNLS